MEFDDNRLNSRVAIFTIATPDFLYQSEVLFSSALRNASAKKFDSYSFVLRGQGCIPLSIPHVKTIYVEEIISKETISYLFSIYSIAEVCWSLKPIIFRWLLSKYDFVYYFDSDIFFTGDICTILRKSRNEDIFLTPHYLDPFFVRSWTNVKSLTLLRSGIFNAGFIGVRNSDVGKEFLSWWCVHATILGKNLPSAGMCGDQRWLDLVPHIFPGVLVSKNYGFNVAYWNIHERELSDNHGYYFVNNKDQLIFFHFSGFDVNDPYHLSSHSRTSYDNCSLIRLIDSYRALVEDSLVRHAENLRFAREKRSRYLSIGKIFTRSKTKTSEGWD